MPALRTNRGSCDPELNRPPGESSLTGDLPKGGASHPPLLSATWSTTQVAARSMLRSWPMEREQRGRGEKRHGAEPAAVQRAPGKTTLTGLLTAHPGSAIGGAPGIVQARGEPDGPGIHEAASRGVAGTPTQLPYHDQIQRLFGHHDIGGIGAHVGGAAANATGAIGAKAYATGNQVAFESQPDLHTAAHEAAHVVQQRGGIQLSGGVGRSGDSYEQHADAVADAVVAGRSAQALGAGAARSICRAICRGRFAQRQRPAPGPTRRWSARGAVDPRRALPRWPGSVHTRARGTSDGQLRGGTRIV